MVCGGGGGGLLSSVSLLFLSSPSGAVWSPPWVVLRSPSPLWVVVLLSHPPSVVRYSLPSPSLGGAAVGLTKLLEMK